MYPTALKPRTIVQHWYTRDAEEAELGLKARFVNASRFRIEGDPGKFRLRCSWASLGASRLISASNTGYEVVGFLEDSVFVAFAVQGSVSVHARGERLRALPRSTALVLRPGDRFNYSMPPGASVLGLQIPLDALVRQAKQTFGAQSWIDRTGSCGHIDLVRGPGTALFRNVASSFREIEALDETGLGELARSSLDEMLLNLALVTLSPKLLPELDRSPKAIGKPAIERAKQYISAFADGPLRISDVARDLGISVRALQVGFQCHVGRTPTQFLFDCRLRKAREQLLAAADTSTVAAIATECGFVNFGAFAARYRRAFGELPSETLLRRHRRRRQ